MNDSSDALGCTQRRTTSATPFTGPTPLPPALPAVAAVGARAVAEGDGGPPTAAGNALPLAPNAAGAAGVAALAPRAVTPIASTPGAPNPPVGSGPCRATVFQFQNCGLNLQVQTRNILYVSDKPATYTMISEYIGVADYRIGHAPRIMFAQSRPALMAFTSTFISSF